jgi:hypothetical protein
MPEEVLAFGNSQNADTGCIHTMSALPPLARHEEWNKNSEPIMGR